MAPAAALVGPGLGEVAEALAWDGAETAALLAGEEPSGPVGAALRSADAVVAFTRSEAVLSALGSRTRRVLAWDPAPPPGGPHASVWLARALVALDVPVSGDPPPLAFTDAERREAEALARGLPDRFLAVHPGSGSPAKNWPEERFVEAALRLAGGKPWLFVRGPAEAGLAVPEGAVDARDWPLRALAAVLSRAGLFLGNDSGAAHLAAASGAPTLSLFGPTDPALWSPVGPAVATLRAPGHAMVALAVDEVTAAAAALRSAATLRSSASGPPSG